MALLLQSSEVCPVCRAPSPALAFVKNGYPLHRCTTCEVVISARPPRKEKLAALYSSEYFTEGGAGYPDYLADERTHRRQARVYLRKLRGLGIAPGSVLDVGCAAGFFLDEARKQGWAVKGCELSEYAQQHAQHALGLDVEQSSFLDPSFSPEPGSFDVVTMFNVLEHLPDPAKVESKVFDALSPGGYLMIETWDPQSWFARLLGSRWPTYAPPTVLYCFTRRALSRLFARGRWSLVSYRPSTKWISAGHGLSLLEYEASRTRLAGVLRALRRSWIGRVDVPYCLGDLALAVFRRTSSHALRPAHSGPQEPRVNVMPAWPCLPV
jgi:SAM-dependent methyltransferase